MNALILDGRQDKAKNKIVYDLLVKKMVNNNINYNSIFLKDIDIKPCLGCFGCWLKTPGICIINDAARDITKQMRQCGIIIFLTPVTFGGYSSDLKKVLDRSIGLILPFFRKINGEIHHKPRYATFPNLICIGTMEKQNSNKANIFKTLVERNAVNLNIKNFQTELIYNNMSNEKNEILADKIINDMMRLS